MVIHNDGSWECQQEERDYYNQDYDHTSKNYLADDDDSDGYNYYRTQKAIAMLLGDPLKRKLHYSARTATEVPQLAPANSFGSTKSSTSSSTMRTAKSRSDGSELSEAAAHELRRQRLAKTRSLAQPYPTNDSTPQTTSTATTLPVVETPPSSPRSNVSSESSYIMKLMRSPPNNRLKPESPPRPKRTAAVSRGGQNSRHVAFLEPSWADTTASLSTSNDADSYRYNEQRGSFFSATSDEESSIFRTVSSIQETNYIRRVPSPQGDGQIDAILGPLPSTGNKSSDSVPPRLGNHRPNQSARVMSDQDGLDEEQEDEPFIHVVTVHKTSQKDKIGLYVGIKRFSHGTRLVVSRISPDGKFANSGVELGDIVVSINGKSFIENPSSQEAFDAVKSATGRVTFVIQKHNEITDSHSFAATTISSVSRDVSSAGDVSAVVPNQYSSTNNSPGSEQRHDDSPGNDESCRTNMMADGSMIISRDSKAKGPNFIECETNESWKLSGAIVICIKKTSASQKPGIRLGIKDTPSGRVLFVADISASSPFANTPLRVGDVVLSINNRNLQEKADVVDAYAALGRFGKSISLVAKKSEQSLNDFLKKGKNSSEVSSPVTLQRENKESDVTTSRSGASADIPLSGSVDKSFGSLENKDKSMVSNHRATCKDVSTPSRQPFEFDDQAYVPSINGYNSSKMIKIVKGNPLEDVGMDLSYVPTDLGRLLTIVSVKPNSKADTAGLNTGDVVLSVNGESFRDSVDPARAITLIQEAQRELVLEIQQIAQDNKVRIGEPECVGKVRTRTFDSNDDFLRQTENLKIAGNAGTTTEEGKVNESAITIEASNVNCLDENSFDGISNSSYRNVKNHVERKEESGTTSLHVRPRKTKNKPRKLWITVTKDHQNQQVGISFAAVNQRLLVTKVSPSGMLCGTPLVPGDTILSINKKDFRSNPHPEEAFRLVKEAPFEVTFEILKTGYVADDQISGLGTKSCLHGPFLCARGRKKGEDHLDLKHQAKQKDDDDTGSLSISVVKGNNTIEV